MPVMSNPCIQNVATVAWDGANAFHDDIRKFVRYGWSFKVTTDLTADTVFTVEIAAPSAADNCAPDAFANQQGIIVCDSPAVAGDATITIPAGTVAGTIVSGTTHCKGAAFVRLAATSGDTADVQAVLVRQGPKI